MKVDVKKKKKKKKKKFWLKSWNEEMGHAQLFNEFLESFITFQLHPIATLFAPSLIAAVICRIFGKKSIHLSY